MINCLLLWSESTSTDTEKQHEEPGEDVYIQDILKAVKIQGYINYTKLPHEFPVLMIFTFQRCPLHQVKRINLKASISIFI